MNFFTFLLLQSSSFDGANDCVQSPAWNSFTTNAPVTPVFFPPSSYHFVNISVCSRFEPSSSVVLEALNSDETSDDLDDNLQEPLSTPPKRNRNSEANADKEPIISEADVRRRLWIQKLNRGFKSSSCKDRNCLGYSAMPPTISSSIIRDLGASCCNINP